MISNKCRTNAPAQDGTPSHHLGAPDAVHSSERPWLDPTERAMVVLFDPEDARMLVEERNAGNRPKSSSQLDYLERELRGGYWRRNGETIIFDKNGDVRNGQHRLTICAKTGIEIESWCVFGVDPDVFNTLDRTKRRNTADDFSLMGEKYCSNLASVLTLVCLEETVGLEQATTGSGTVSGHQIEEALGRHPAARDACAYWAQHRGLRRATTPKLGAFCFYRFSQSDINKAHDFFRKLDTGDGLELDNPILILRNRLLENRASKAKLNPKDELALIVKAWNLFKSGHKARHLSWRSEGKNPEAFPSIS